MIDVSDSANIEIHAVGARNGAMIFNKDVFTFLEILQYRRGQVPKDEHVLKYPFWPGGYYGD